MPWCEDCSRFWSPNSMPPEGTCPSCGRTLAEPASTKVPWHFWLLVAGVSLYLGWRVLQGGLWLLGR